jgi:hypothetical protein
LPDKRLYRVIISGHNNEEIPHIEKVLYYGVYYFMSDFEAFVPPPATETAPDVMSRMQFLRLFTQGPKGALTAFGLGGIFQDPSAPHAAGQQPTPTLVECNPVVTVQPGDTLDSIRIEQHYTNGTNNIAANSKISNPDLIHAGDEVDGICPEGSVPSNNTQNNTQEVGWLPVVVGTFVVASILGWIISRRNANRS